MAQDAVLDRGGALDDPDEFDALLASLSPTDWARGAALGAASALEAAVARVHEAEAALARAAAVRNRAVAAVHDASLDHDAAAAILRDVAAGEGAPLRAVRAADVSERSARAEIALALRMSEHAAGDLVHAVRGMTERHPAIIAAMDGGTLPERHAMRLLRAIAGLLDEAAARVVAEALPRADRPLAAFGRIVDRLVRRFGPMPPEEAHREAREGRCVWVQEDRDGTATISALLPAVQARAIHDRLTGIAAALERDPAERRSRGQLRADALCDLLLDGETDSLPSSVRGIRPTVHITVPALAAATGDAAAHGEAEVDGLGPIDLETALGLIGAASEWTRIVTRPSATPCSRSTATATVRRRRSLASRAGCTRRAPSPAAAPPRTAASSTTSSTGRAAAAPGSGTSTRCAPGITPSSTPPAGTSRPTPAAA